MPESRGIWSGTLSFGLVNVPVSLFSATRGLDVAMRMVSPDGTPLERRYYCDKGEMLTWDDIVRGYEIEKGEYVIVEDDELERLAPEKTRSIDLRQFVKVEELDPVYFESGYYLAPSGSNTKAYKLLAAVMEDDQLAGIATFVLREKEYLVAIMSEKGILRAETLRFADELRTPESIGLPAPSRVATADVKKMERAIAKLTEGKFDEKELVDQSAVKLLDIVVKKLEKGKDVVAAPAGESEGEETDSNVIDLMAALERSLKRGKTASRRRRRQSSRA